MYYLRLQVDVIDPPKTYCKISQKIDIALLNTPISFAWDIGVISLSCLTCCIALVAYMWIYQDDLGLRSETLRPKTVRKRGNYP
jgi:hypothetical protein